MGKILCRIIGIHDMILKVDNQSKQCMRMVWGVWMILALCTACSASVSIGKVFHKLSAELIVLTSFTGTIIVFASLYILYRRLLCLTLFEEEASGWKILCLELMVCLISIFCWSPDMMSLFVGDWSTGYSIFELIQMNRAGFSFLLLCLGMILTLNVISEYALILACKRHRQVASSIFNV